MDRHSCHELKNFIDIILKITNKSATILADAYILKDVSIISKWKNGKAVPKSEDLYQIVNFAAKEASIIQKKLIRTSVESLVLELSIPDDIAKSIISIEGYEPFLIEVLNMITIGEISRKPQSICACSVLNAYRRKSDMMPKEILSIEEAIRYIKYNLGDDIKYGLVMFDKKTDINSLLGSTTLSGFKAVMLLSKE